MCQADLRKGNKEHPNRKSNQSLLGNNGKQLNTFD